MKALKYQCLPLLLRDFFLVVKNIKATYVTLYVAGILGMLCTVSWFAPEGGWDVGGTHLKFLTYEDILHPRVQEKADITDLLSNIDTSLTADPLLIHQNGSNGSLGAPNGGEISADGSSELQMSEAGRNNLNAFFQVLSGVAANKQKISILHYGDSQIEGDRMTCYIRQKIQDQFGGFGPGLIPATNVYSTISYIQKYSESFQRFTCFGGSSLRSNNYGAMASVARFTPEYAEGTFLMDTLQEKTGWIEFSPSGSAYERARQYNNVKMHYNSCIAPTQLKVYQNGSLIHEEALKTDGGQHTVTLTFPSTPGKLKYEFSGKISPNICAFSLEGDYGVQVSNIGMRGSSGTIFGKIKHGGLRTMYNELNTELVIMQFGGNSVPSFKDSASVRGYVNYFKGQLNTLKGLAPNAMIIVIGPSDMSKLNEGLYETYPLLPYCVEKMREATVSVGGAYWNLYAAMGGKNSMPAWVEKGLAGNDYIHFSTGGAKFASQLFYNALISEYAKWKSNP